MQLVDKDKRVIFSAIQPSGTITLGNYIGAIKNWVRLQDDFNCIFAVADLHAITVRQDKKTLKENILKAYALLLACGIDLKKSLFFIQSHVPAHSELAWILSCYTQFGELSRMTQFKQKAKQHSDNINLGLFSYPVLQVADILLYQADLVPIGADQKQHLELTRNIAQRFNNAYSKTFKVPEAFIPKSGAKIMSLQDPLKKMSKSDENENAYVSILDEPNVILKKFKRAITDSEAEVAFKDGKDGINNLINIYSSITGKSIKAIEEEFKGKGYGNFKEQIAKSVIEELNPIRERYNELIKDKTYLEENYKQCAKIASEISSKTLYKVKKKIGFII